MAGLGDRCRRDSDCETICEAGLTLDGVVSTAVCIDRICTCPPSTGTPQTGTGGGGTTPPPTGGECQPEGFPCSYYLLGGESPVFVDECCAGLICDQATENQQGETRFSDVSLPPDINLFVGTCRRVPETVPPSPSQTPSPSRTPNPSVSISPSPTPTPSISPTPQASRIIIPDTVSVFCSPTGTFENCRRVEVEGTASEGADQLCAKIGEFACDPTPPPPPPSTPPVSPRQWRSCVDGKLYDGNPPSNYEQFIFSGEGGGACWQPVAEVGFVPSLENIRFDYKRGSGVYPQPLSFTAENPSISISYKVTLKTNDRYFKITPSTFEIEPQGSVNFEIRTVDDRDKIEEIADGQTRFTLQVETLRI